MDFVESREWLDAAWREALDAGDQEPDPEVDQLTNSRVKSIRYAIITQLLGKIADPERNLLALQQRDDGQGSWDARSFAKKVIVPWEADNHGVLGSSSEPYASKPLRRTKLYRGMDNVRNAGDWEALVEFLEPLESAPSENLHDAFKRVMASLARMLAEQQITYPIPQRIGLPQLMNILEAFLATSSGGLRPLAVATALFRIAGEGFSLFDDVQSQGINEADAASGMPGDIMCRKGGELCLVIEVKDQNLTLADAQSSTRKAKESGAGLTDLLFAVPATRRADDDDIAELFSRNFAAGLNIYVAQIQSLSYHAFALLKEEWRVRFVREICSELDARQEQPARKAWHDLLLGLN
ncbi:MAG: restriction endonuclease, SacI family [Boseongicola sp. SB0675_bin_26]|nr:restriction endonuclease, SacI family [Boseongicola sp. SB0675_bin_26]